MRTAAVLAILSLAACQTMPERPPPIVVTQKIEVPVPVPCAPDLGPEPDYVTDAEFMAAPDIFQAVLLYKRDRLISHARLAELAAALNGCSELSR